MSETSWLWMIGFLHGFGECMWQQHGDVIRRITRPIVVPQNGGLLLQKSMACLAAREDSPVWDADKMVIEGRLCKEDLAAEADRAWSGGVIQPVNGTPRFKTS